MLVYTLRAVRTSFPKVPFTNEEATGVINSVVIGTNTAPRKPHSCFFIRALMFQ